MDFIIQRFTMALDSMLASLPAGDENANYVRDNFYGVANAQSPLGMYALIDYVNFKGTGVSPQERYQEQGWGLLQVLLHMDNRQPPLQSFVQAAKRILEQRVANAPEQRQEQRWLTGWHNRLDTYLEAPQLPDNQDSQE